MSLRRFTLATLAGISVFVGGMIAALGQSVLAIFGSRIGPPVRSASQMAPSRVTPDWTSAVVVLLVAALAAGTAFAIVLRGRSLPSGRPGVQEGGPRVV
jgi:hypothetical protein